ncbi:MAG: tRNA 2-thiocytidine biosynthesis protein TtcA [Halanaerobiales bacterium]|nr:tRNA 2-thiocytidine biosynthesis protein TtcA [Halanaerobiales bacterium]
MELSLPKSYNNKIIKAIAEFNLIEEGDNILVGLSGGKDSAFLLYALTILRRNLAVNFNLSALTVDLGFAGSDFASLKDFCQKLGIPYYIKRTEIAEYILDEKVDNPCAKCAHFRKGAMAEFMKEHGFNKVAFGHHYDDAVETFLMSIIYSGQIMTLKPKRHLSHNDIFIIRPLIYLREKKIIEAGKLMGFKPLESPCPYDGRTVRAEIRALIREKQIFFNLAGAMRQGTSMELWPEEPPREELAAKMNELWTGKNNKS